jgi:hypothetical protein
LAVLGFEVRALSLVGRYSTTWIMLAALFALGTSWRWSCVYAWATWTTVLFMLPA